MESRIKVNRDWRGRSHSTGAIKLRREVSVAV
jgi:hypothetical protein